jgi:ADP-ribosylglycohydrolase
MLDQFRGCLLGLACAERFGADSAAVPAESAPLESATSQMLCVLESYCDAGGFDPHDMADRLASAWGGGASRPVIAADSTVLAGAIARLRLGYNFERASFEAWNAAEPAQRLEGACLLRAAPTGLLRYFDNIHLVGESRVVCAITHHDELCRFACAIFNMALAHLMLVGGDGLLDELLEFAGPRNAVLRDAIRVLPTLQPAALRCSENVVDMLQTGLWLAQYCDTLEEALTVLQAAAGSQPGQAALCGALLGVRTGTEGIPAEWLDDLMEGARIERGARRLYELAMQG